MTMRRFARLLLPLFLTVLALFPHQALAGGPVDVETAVSPSGAGMAWQDGSGHYNTGDQVNVHAQANYGYAFDHWEIDSVGNFSNSYCSFSLSGLSDCTIVAKAVFHEHLLDPVSAKYPTCVATGVIEHFYCPWCGKHIAPDGVTVLSQSEWELPATGEHSWYESGITTPTCINNGLRELTCSNCGAVTYEGIPATGLHDWTDWETIAAAGCEADGTRWRHCKTPGCGAEQYEGIPATGHSWSDWSTHVPATCTSAGERERTCTSCGSKDVESVPATGHTWKDTAYKAATCTADGNAAYSTCTVCGLIVDSPSAMDVYDKIPTIPATGHSWGSWKNSKAATCTESGTESRTCTACGDIQSRGIAALGHSWGAWKTTKQPTCTANGEEQHACERCAAVETRSTLKALGHEWDEGTVTVEPTTSSVGVRTYTCKRCGATRTEPINKKSSSDKGGSSGSGGNSGGSGGNVTPTPTPAPKPAPSSGLPIPLIVAGVLGCLGLGGLIVLLVMRQRDKDEEPDGGYDEPDRKPSHMK